MSKQKKNKNDLKRIQAIAKIHEGLSIRKIAQELKISKSRVGQWKREFEEENGTKIGSEPPKSSKVAQEVTTLKKATTQNVKVSDRYSDYIDTLRIAKDRQGKWAGAITETGIRALKFANKFLAKVERKEELTKSDMELIKLIPTMLNASASAIRSAGEAEDRAYSLELVAEKLDELPQQIQGNSQPPDPRVVVADD